MRTFLLQSPPTEGTSAVVEREQPVHVRSFRKPLKICELRSCGEKCELSVHIATRSSRFPRQTFSLVSSRKSCCPCAFRKLAQYALLRAHPLPSCQKAVEIPRKDRSVTSPCCLGCGAELVSSDLAKAPFFGKSHGQYFLRCAACRGINFLSLRRLPKDALEISIASYRDTEDRTWVTAESELPRKDSTRTEEPRNGT